MKKVNKDKLDLHPEYQLTLYGYKKYFDTFAKLFALKKLPNTLLLNGSKGLGKSTFVYHFINYLLSLGEDNKYDMKNYIINQENKNYKLSINNINQNFFKINNKIDKDIGIDEIRNLINFLNKSSDLNNLKLILIDNIENLNKNSLNALLKVLEEPKENTHFFLIFDSNKKLLNTVKSRCSEFKIYFTKNEKDEIFKNLVKDHELKFSNEEILNALNYETPGNLLNYINSLDDNYTEISSSELNFIINCIKKYEIIKDKNLYKTLIFLIDKFYYNLCFNNINKLNKHIFNYEKITKQMYYLKKFNLNEKITLKSITNILLNETR